MYWGFMLKLSTHMWSDESAGPAGWYLKPQYHVCNQVDLDVWDSTVKFLAEHKYNMVLIDVGDGIRYESHPEISAPDAWDKDFLRKKLGEMRALGLEPIPKLNFSTSHDTWLKEYRRMVSSTPYYRACADVIREVCEVFDSPKLFHLGFDEERPEYQQNCENVVVRNGELWWHDLFFLAKECEKYGARPWIWSDYVWNNEKVFLEKMPRSILQSNWYYGGFQNFPAEHPHYAMIRAYELLDSHGYDQILTGSTWSIDDNLYQTVAHGKSKLTPALVSGYLAAPWQFTLQKTKYTLMDDAYRMYLARCELYPETL